MYNVYVGQMDSGAPMIGNVNYSVGR